MQVDEYLQSVCYISLLGLCSVANKTSCVTDESLALQGLRIDRTFQRIADQLAVLTESQIIGNFKERYQFALFLLKSHLLQGQLLAVLAAHRKFYGCYSLQTQNSL